jgi:hypothetical protein
MRSRNPLAPNCATLALWFWPNAARSEKRGQAGTIRQAWFTMR